MRQRSALAGPIVLPAGQHHHISQHQQKHPSTSQAFQRNPSNFLNLLQKRIINLGELNNKIYSKNLSTKKFSSEKMFRRTLLGFGVDDSREHVKLRQQQVDPRLALNGLGRHGDHNRRSQRPLSHHQAVSHFETSF